MNQNLSTLIYRVRKNAVLRSYLALVSGILCLSVAPLFVRITNAPGIVTSFYRMTITTMILLPLALARRGSSAAGSELPRLALFNKKYLLFPILAGISSALDHALWSSAIHHTEISNASILNSISPVWVSLFALFVLKEKLKNSFWIGLVLVLGGVFGVSGMSIRTFSSGFSYGDLLSIASSVFYAGYFVATELGRRSYPAMTQMAISLIFCSLTMGIVVLVNGAPLAGYDAKTWLLFFLIAVISQLGGYFSLTIALGSLPASVVSPAIQIQPVISSFLAAAFLNEPITSIKFISVVIVLAGVYLIDRSKRSDIRTGPSAEQKIAEP